jgi:1-deoxy-D-xylulose-5-phosphate synthase
MALGLAIPGMTVFAPSSAPEVEVMLAEALGLDGPSMIRFPKTPAPWVPPGTVGTGLHARKVRAGDGSVCVLAVGKMVTAAEEAARQLEAEGVNLTVWDVRVVSDPDPAMLADAGTHSVVITAEDGVRQGGAGMFMADALRASVPEGSAPRIITLGIPRAFIPQGKPDRILARLGLDGDGLARSVREASGTRTETVTDEARPPKAPIRPASLPATLTGHDTTD